MIVLQTMHGNPIVTIRQITEQFSISDRTARSIVKELEAEHARYGDAVLGDGKLARVNYLCFTDYWKNRKMLRDTNVQKHVPPYRPAEVAASLGFYDDGWKEFDEMKLLAGEWADVKIKQ